MALQASGNWRARSARLAALCAGALVLAACGEHVEEGKDCPAAARAATLTGLCVPRYVSLKGAKVMARKGPGEDYPALWEYRAKGLPVQIVAETLEWRRVCDPDGGAVWVSRSMLAGHRTAEATAGAPVALLRAPRQDAPVAALLNARALADLGRCQGGWCRVSVGGVSGWAPAGRLWGVDPAAQCR